MVSFRFNLFTALLALAVVAFSPHPLSQAEDGVRSLPATGEALPFSAGLVPQGFVDVQELDPGIRVELKYASEDNFMRVAVYGGLRRAFLREEAALKLALANRYLKELRPELTLLVADALRPRSVSQRMWSHLSGSPMQRYVADPRWGSMHNYGIAVDVTVCYADGERLDMGTPIDYFGELAEPRLEERFLMEGRLTEEQLANRRLLRKVMHAAGFQGIPIEWWHFEALDKKLVRKAYDIIE